MPQGTRRIHFPPRDRVYEVDALGGVDVGNTPLASALGGVPRPVSVSANGEGGGRSLAVATSRAAELAHARAHRQRAVNGGAEAGEVHATLELNEHALT